MSAARPESQPWRSAVLHALDLVHVWGGGPVAMDTWVSRYRPHVKRASAQKAWERMKAGLRRVGLVYRIVQGPRADYALELDPAAVVRVYELALALDRWLERQPPLEGLSPSAARKRRFRKRRRSA